MVSVLKCQAELIIKNEEITTPQYRMLIVMGQVGQLSRYLYRDNKEKEKLIGVERAANEKVREVGSKSDEELKLGEAIMQLAIYAETRELNLDSGLTRAFDKISGKDWKKDNVDDTPVIASDGRVYGEILHINSRDDLMKLEGKKSGVVIAILGTTEPDIAHLVIMNEWVVGVVCSVGGKTSHPAVVAREFQKPCLMNYKSDIPEGAFGELIATKEELGKLGVYPVELQGFPFNKE
jgi:phosphohistidine swiveling domain-containing protein